MDDLDWFALRVRPRYEKLLSSMLRSKGYEEFLPLYRSRRRWSDRFKEIELPLFPGYMFCRFRPREKYPVISVPGVLQIVGLGSQPVPVSAVELEGVRRLVESGMSLMPWSYLETGQRVQVGFGPLKGLEGHVVSVRNTDRLVISVTLLQRAVSVELDSSWVRPQEVTPRLSAAPLTGLRPADLPIQG